jgi:hypothetical protein
MKHECSQTISSFVIIASYDKMKAKNHCGRKHMIYVWIGIAAIGIIVFTVYVNKTSFTQRQRDENLKEENAHRDLNDLRKGHDSLKNRMK